MRKNEAAWIEARHRWQINVQQDGERKTFTDQTPGIKGKVACERKADKWTDDATNKDVRFKVLWDLFLAEAKEMTGTENYIKHEQMGRLWLLPAIKHKRISSITNQDWQTCINKAFKQGKSKKSLKNIRASITAVYRYAKKDKYPLDRPEDLTIPADAPEGERTILQPDKLKLFFTEDTINDHGKTTGCFFIHAWRFLVLTGLRPGELAGLKRGEDVADSVLKIQRAINRLGETTKGKNKRARRTIVLSQRAVDELAEQEIILKRRGIISPWLFPNEDGTALDTIHMSRKWRTYRRQHGITCTLYELRHTMISISKADVPEQLLKAIVGHGKSMDTYGTYGHEVDGELSRAATLINKAFDVVLK